MSSPDKLRKFENRPDTDRQCDTLACDMVCEPVSGLKPVYWESCGRILGPGQVSTVAKVGEQFWLSIEYAGCWRWIEQSLLRSQRQYEQQNKPVCHCCGGTDFWISVHAISICRRCHPPASSSVINKDHDAR
jgi:hypothetical protein